MDSPDSEAASPSSDGYSENLFPYSRDEYVAAITDFYTLLTRLHIPESALNYPPPGGWPSITPETCAGFGKSDFVVDLLKHLPYINDGEDRSLATQVNYKTNVLDYSVLSPKEFSSKRLKLGEDVACLDEEEEAPLEDIVVLTKGYESGGRYVLLNTRTGQVIEEMIRCSRVYEDDAIWYFEQLREEYRTLHLVPVPGANTIDMLGDVSDIPDAELPDPRTGTLSPGECSGSNKTDVRWLRHIYRKHGWPGSDYRKEEALKAIADYMEATPYDW